MLILFISNYFNHHQKPFSDFMYKNTNKNFVFIETAEISEERKKLGWGYNNYPNYVIKYQNVQEINEIIDKADIVIIGSAPIKLVKNRIKKNKIVFKYSERPLKNNNIVKFLPRFIKWNYQNPRNKNIYMLSASAYTAYDYSKFGLFKNKCYKWGYFPQVNKCENIEQLIEKKNKNSILWVARFIECKHPEIIIEISKMLIKDNYNFELNMIGNGVLLDNIKELVKINNLEKNVHLLGVMKPEEVREYMEESEIFLFTSDRGEGWGAVLNESMNSACAVVASHEIGSVPFLIKNKENGLIYKDGDINSLYKKVKFLIDNEKERKQIAKNAYLTMINEWNAENAANRLLQLSEKLLNGEKYPDLFKDGVCSKAEIIKDDWFKDE